VTWAVAGTSLLSVGLALTVAVLALRIGGLKEERAKLRAALESMTTKRDEYREALHELKTELQKSGLSAARDIHVLKARLDECKADINALPDSQLTRAFVNARLDRLLQGEDATPRDPSHR
jgi:chromosome segregation ATPase